MEFNGFQVPFGLVAGRPRQAPNVLAGSAIIALDSDLGSAPGPSTLTDAGPPQLDTFSQALERRLGQSPQVGERYAQWPAQASCWCRPSQLDPLDGLGRQPELAIQVWRTLRPLAAPACPPTAGCPLLVLATTVLLGPGSAQGPSRVTLAGPTRPDTVSQAWGSRLGQSPQVGERYAH